jgi:hypothetical protein
LCKALRKQRRVEHLAGLWTAAAEKEHPRSKRQGERKQHIHRHKCREVTEKSKQQVNISGEQLAAGHSIAG